MSEYLCSCVCVTSTFLTPETRKAMGEQAVTLARAVDYTSAGQLHWRRGWGWWCVDEMSVGQLICGGGGGRRLD